MTISRSGQMVAAAKACIRHVSADEAGQLLDNSGYVFVDVRDSSELSAGKIPGSIHSPRGSLEFALDQGSDFPEPALLSGRTLIMVCGSGARGALSAKLASDMGLDVVCLEGGMKAWRASGLPLMTE